MEILSQAEFDVVGIGALNYDRLHFVDRFAKAGEEIKITRIFEAPGGSAANTIAALARLGVRCSFIGFIGDDEEGRKMLKDFQDAGVNLSCIRKIGERSGTAIGFVDEKGERLFYLYSGANDYFKADEKVLEHAKKAKIIHVSSFALEKCNREVGKIIRQVKEENEKVKLSYAPGFLCLSGKENLKENLELTDILFCNEKEIKALACSDSAEKAVLGIKREFGIEIICITSGKKGCLIIADSSTIKEKAFRARVVDTTGAGDAFNAGFLYGIIKNKSLRECAKIANFLAAKCIEREGARQGLLSENELGKVLRL